MLGDDGDNLVRYCMLEVSGIVDSYVRPPGRLRRWLGLLRNEGSPLTFELF
jgi:hypothetical protein